jgi:hypothetical protein
MGGTGGVNRGGAATYCGVGPAGSRVRLTPQLLQTWFRALLGEPQALQKEPLFTCCPQPLQNLALISTDFPQLLQNMYTPSKV